MYLNLKLVELIINAVFTLEIPTIGEERNYLMHKSKESTLADADLGSCFP